MQYMVIKLDEERVRAEGKYSLEKMWKIIDHAFREGNIIKKPQADGSVEYWGNPNDENYLGYFGAAYIELKQTKWLAVYAKKWIWYENDDNEELPYQETDCLARARKQYGMI